MTVRDSAAVSNMKGIVQVHLDLGRAARARNLRNRFHCHC